MVVVLAGGELNAELAKGTGEVAPEPKTEYDKEVAAAQTERTKEDRHEEKKKEQKEVRSNAKREQLAKGEGVEGRGPGERVAATLPLRRSNWRLSEDSAFTDCSENCKGRASASS